MTKEEKLETRRFLSSYRVMKSEIQARERELALFIREMYNPLKATVLDGMPRGGKRGDQTAQAAMGIQKSYEKMMREMQTHIEELTQLKRRIEEAIEQLDEYERCVCYWRYIMGVYWADLPEHVGYEVAQCQRIEARALEKIFRFLQKKPTENKVENFKF